MILACCLARQTKSSLHRAQGKVSNDTMQGKGNCDAALCEFTLLLSMFLIRFFVIDSGLNPCDLQLFLKAGSAYSCSPSLPHFLGAISRQDKMVVQSEGCILICAQCIFIETIWLTLPLGPSLIWSWVPPILFFYNGKFLQITISCFFLKLHFSISEICPCGCSLGFQKWSCGS